MSYTVLRIVDGGVILFEQHRRRFEPAGSAATQAFDAFAQAATPGVYSLLWTGSRLEIVPRHASRLFDGMPTRIVSSPVCNVNGGQAKSPAPNVYDAVRADGIATLLSSPDGTELYEACSAAVVSWRNGTFILVPADRPRVASTVEHWLAEAAPCVEEPLPARSTQPLALINAVKGICLADVAGREPFPELARQTVLKMLPATARRP